MHRKFLQSKAGGRSKLTVCKVDEGIRNGDPNTEMADSKH
jgi:hypothetical protein